ncbi:DUF2680 domain-containing protein [Peribacillus sp. SCS-37]|uniref:DUF2680 domain-containing protein n=1 Tax=Paraperibacillus esterisolvens TaxID=3115296 RepID=UPI003906741B
MKKLAFTFMAAIALLLSHNSAASAQTEQPQPEFKLTQQQKEELLVIHRNLLTEKKRLISKYIEFGVIPEEKGKKMLKRIEEHYTLIEKKGFVPFEGKKEWKHHHKGMEHR